MLNKIILFSLRNRLMVVAFGVLILIYGVITLINLPVDVLPDLNRPRVTIFLEANGMSPEEIETQVALPVETALNGAPGVEVVRSVSSPGLGLVFVEFDWNTDIYRARQLTAEKLQTVQLPNGVTPQMGPISSIMGQIMMIAVYSDSASPATLRTLSDFTIRRRLLSVKGVSQVIPIGGDRLQYQVKISSEKLKQYNISIDDVDKALQLTNQNTTGGFVDNKGSELLIRNVARANTLEDLASTVVANRNNAPVLLKQVADVEFGAGLKRGDGSFDGKPAVILSVEKQPGANTVTLTDNIIHVVDEIRGALPKNIHINTDVFQQKNFIVNSITNVNEALRDGTIMVIIILFLFLMNFRTTFITLTAIPLSIIITAIVFKLFNISINTLTLGGLAIAIGALVDDAIVGVENVFRRLKENYESKEPRPVTKVIYEASLEVRNSIVYATVIVVLVFIPLFYLQGIEGKIFAPLGVAYITSILASLLVSLTITSALCSYLLGKEKYLRHVNLAFWKKKKEAYHYTHGEEVESMHISNTEKIAFEASSHDDSAFVKFLKRQDIKLLHWGLKRPKLIMGLAIALIVAAIAIVPFFGSEFLPTFNEGSYVVVVTAPAGTSLEESNKIGTLAEHQILKVPEVASTSRRTGRAELDEHAQPPNFNEIDVALKPSKRSREEVLAEIRKNLSVLKGAGIGIGQPISHRLEHLLSGVQAQIAIKIYGEDLNMLRSYADRVQSIASSVPGAVDVQVENQVLIPQLVTKLNRDALQRYSLQAGKVAEDLEIFYNGKTESQIIDGIKSFDLVLRTNDSTRKNIDAIKNTQIATGDGALIPLQQIAKVQLENNFNVINHENALRRIVVSANVQGRDLGGTVKEIQDKVKKELPLTEGYYIDWEGQFQSQQEASRLILILSIFSFAGIFLVLYGYFKSTRIALQIMLNIPLALVGSVVAVALTGGVFSVATMVGFITLTGIASRNGILMLSHYIHLVEHEGEAFDDKMIIRGTLERLVPVLMTALVAALALIPLTLDAAAPGKEILYPVAVVILGGLISSTLLDMIVTPVVFKQFGKKALDHYLKVHKKQDEFE